MREYLTLTMNIMHHEPTRPNKERTWVRRVTITDEDVELAAWEADGHQALLERIWVNGQNDFQARCAPSLSVGDLIVLDEPNRRDVYRVAMCGFKRVAIWELTTAERLMVRFGTTSIHEALLHQFDETEREIHATGDLEAVERFRKAASEGY